MRGAHLATLPACSLLFRLEPHGEGQVDGGAACVTRRSKRLAAPRRAALKLKMPSTIRSRFGVQKSREIQLESTLRRRRGLHPISPMATRGTQRVLQPLYLALRLFDSNPNDTLPISVSIPVRLGPTVGSVRNVEVVHRRRGNMAVSTDVLIRFAHLLGVPCSTSSRDVRMHPREPQSGQDPVALETPAASRQERASGDHRPWGGTVKPPGTEIVPPRREKPAEMDLRSGFQPLFNLPQNVPRRWRNHWRKLADQAATSYRAAVELKCLECCAWQRTEARRCEIRGCPLWTVSRRIFRSSTRSEALGE